MLFDSLGYADINHYYFIPSQEGRVMYTASCLCGEIQLDIHQNIDKIYVCHCKSCQKAQGAAFAAVAVIEKNIYRLNRDRWL